jgi:DNA-binding PadR family transcriptional regulator
MEFRMPSYFALATLVDGPLHGYAIVQRAAELSDGRSACRPARCTRCSSARSTRGSSWPASPYREGGRQRRDYTLTQIGRAELQAEAQRLAHAGAHGHAPAAPERHGGDAMSGERIAELALLSYPPSARAARGEEMLATLQDASAGSRRRFVREIADLVRLGLRARGAQTASAGARRIVADGLCLAAVWIMTLDVSTLLSQRARGMGDPCSRGHRSRCWPPCSPRRSSALTDSRAPARWCGPPCASRRCGTTHAGLVNLAPEVLPIVCFCVLVLAPRRRAPDPRRLAWLLVPATLVAAAGPAPGEASPLLVPAYCWRRSWSSWQRSRCCRPTRAWRSRAPSV